MKEVGVHHRLLENQPLWSDTWREVRFTLADARRALPYVARVIEDASQAYLEIQRTRRDLQCRIEPMHRLELDGQRLAALRRLDNAIDECNAVGADLLNIPQGLVRFSAEIEGRWVSLLWRLGESVINAWTSLA